MTGREKCELMKTLRREIAEANGIVYLSSECDFIGDCPGHCPKCDAEARYLDTELNLLMKKGQPIQVASLSYSAFLKKLDSSDDAPVSSGEENPDDFDMGLF